MALNSIDYTVEHKKRATNEVALRKYFLGITSFF